MQELFEALAAKPVTREQLTQVVGPEPSELPAAHCHAVLPRCPAALSCRRRHRRAAPLLLLEGGLLRRAMPGQ